MTKHLEVFVIILAAASASAQTIPFDSDRWEISARESKIEDYLGRQSLTIKGGQAILKVSNFTNGIVEFDIAFGADRGFMGGIWRWQDGRNYEEFYLRPHQSGKPDANQYTPVFNGTSAWQLYHGSGYGVAIDYEFDEWMRVKIVVSGKSAEMYIKDMSTPLLFTGDLKRTVAAGRVGVSAGNFAAAHFSNFSFAVADNPTLKGKAETREPVRAGTIMSWWVSNTFKEKSLENKFSLGRPDKEDLTWRKMDCEPSGIVNFARLSEIQDDKNTVFAKVMVLSRIEQVKKLSFGYSDRVKVYLNDRLIYGGDNGYGSRDFRFLGTIGYFDEVYLSLKPGKNRVLLAVSESFGGWGVQARFDDLDGIEIEQ